MALEFIFPDAAEKLKQGLRQMIIIYTTPQRVAEWTERPVVIISADPEVVKGYRGKALIFADSQVVLEVKDYLGPDDYVCTFYERRKRNGRNN